MQSAWGPRGTQRTCCLSMRLLADACALYDPHAGEHILRGAAGVCTGDSRISFKIEALNLEDSSYVGEENDVEPAEAGAAEQGSAEEQGDDGEWELAAVSANAARRRRRKQVRYDARVAANSLAEAAGQPPDSTLGGVDDDASTSEDGALPAFLRFQCTCVTRPLPCFRAWHLPLHTRNDVLLTSCCHTSRIAVTIHHLHVTEGTHGDEEGAEAEVSDDEAVDNAASHPEDSEASEDGAADEQQQEQGEASTSSVVCVTADFAMQNVILQMGLRLASPDGRRIQQTRRWALRCSACSEVSNVRPAAVLPFCPEQATCACGLVLCVAIHLIYKRARTRQSM